MCRQVYVWVDGSGCDGFERGLNVSNRIGLALYDSRDLVDMAWR